MRVLFGRGMANRTATYINFIRPDGGVRAFRIHDDTSLVRLDPQAHQAAWVFLNGRLLSLPRRPRSPAVRHRPGDAVPARARSRRAVRGVRRRAFDHARLAAFGWSRRRHLVRAHDRCAHRAVTRVCRDRERHRRPFEPASRQARLKHRWVVALVFGLVHGLGFSIALQETLQFAGSHPIAALVSYNIGLELGTLIILAITCRR